MGVIKDIYTEVKERGIEYDHWCSDLYVPVTPETTELVKRYEFSRNVTKFKAQDTNEIWYDIPFAFWPYAEGRLS